MSKETSEIKWVKDPVKGPRQIYNGLFAEMLLLMFNWFQITLLYVEAATRGFSIKRAVSKIFKYSQENICVAALFNPNPVGGDLTPTLKVFVSNSKFAQAEGSRQLLLF